jgi:hypothetical protein
MWFDQFKVAAMTFRLDKEMWQLFANIATTLGLIGLIFAAYTYWKSIRLRRAEWLYELYSKFYEQAHYKEIRWILDYEPADQMSILRECVEEMLSAKSNAKQLENRELVEAFVDYLNFFEFIANLWNLKQLSLDEVKRAFAYYIRRLGDHDFVLQFLDYDFENLQKMLPKIRVGHGN